MLSRILIFALILFMPFASRGAADDSTAFMSLRSGEANLRSGPGYRYPTTWVYRRPSLPFAVLATYEHWYKVRASDGETGWLHQSMLARRRTVRAMEPHVARRGPSDQTRPVARIEPGAVGTVLKCGKAWCKIAWTADIESWSERKTLWGVGEKEEID